MGSNTKGTEGAMNQTREIQSINDFELSRAIEEGASWHDQYKNSKLIFVGGLPYDLSEGDLGSVFSQYGDIEKIKLMRDKESGKSKGFAFIEYVDQRSTVLAVDNFNGIKILNRTIRVDHAHELKERSEKQNTEADDAKVARMAQAIWQSTGVGSPDNHKAGEDRVQSLTEEEARRLRKQERRERETPEERRQRKERSRLQAEK